MRSISRRSFLKLTGATAAAVAGTAMLSGCGIRTVTVIAVMNGEEVNREKVPMPDFVSVDWAIGLMKPVLLLTLKAQYPELGDAANLIEISADPDVPGNGKQTQDENGNWIMTVAIKTNLANASATVRTVDGTTLLFTSVPVLDTWTTLPDNLLKACAQEFADQYPYYTVTLVEGRADNGRIDRTNRNKPTVTVYVNAVKKA